MRKRFGATCALAAVLVSGGPTLMADHGDQGDKQPPASNRSSDNDDEGWQQRNGYGYRLYGSEDRPPGWSHGQKAGWGNCGLPPELAKKYDCRTYTYQGRPYYYFQESDGRMVVRRPSIEVHGSVDIAH
jgi:hypothetical protein